MIGARRLAILSLLLLWAPALGMRKKVFNSAVDKRNGKPKYHDEDGTTLAKEETLKLSEYVQAGEKYFGVVAHAGGSSAEAATAAGMGGAVPLPITSNLTSASSLPLALVQDTRAMESLHALKPRKTGKPRHTVNCPKADNATEMYERHIASTFEGHCKTSSVWDYCPAGVPQPCSLAYSCALDLTTCAKEWFWHVWDYAEIGATVTSFVVSGPGGKLAYNTMKNALKSSFKQLIKQGGQAAKLTYKNMRKKALAEVRKGWKEGIGKFKHIKNIDSKFAAKYTWACLDEVREIVQKEVTDAMVLSEMKAELGAEMPSLADVLTWPPTEKSLEFLETYDVTGLSSFVHMFSSDFKDACPPDLTA